MDDNLKIKLWYLFYVNRKQLLIIYAVILLLTLGLAVYYVYYPIPVTPDMKGFGRFYAENAIAFWLVLAMYSWGEGLFFWNFFYKEQIKVIEQQKKEILEKNSILSQQKEEIQAQSEEIMAQRDIAIKQKEKIEEQNKQITDSIRYAKRIQTAVLPLKSDLDKFVRNFVLYLPKEIVSGDFYWFRQIDEDNFIIAVADCTGHGVPGAFVSMLGITLLNEIVAVHRITEPSAILNNLRVAVKKSLHQHGAELEQQDGMDIAVVNINKSKMILEYAGANNPVYISRKNGNFTENERIILHKCDDRVMLELKPDKMPVGIYANEYEFTSLRIDILKDDTVYLFSDGFADQFSEKTGRKFLSKRFRNTICELSVYDIDKQKDILEDIFMNWKGNLNQIDDVLVLGLNI